MKTLQRRASSLEYNLRSKEATVVFPAGVEWTVDEVLDYWDDTTDCCVRRVAIYTYGNSKATIMGRNEAGEWITLAETVR